MTNQDWRPSREDVRRIIDDALNSAFPQPREVADHATDRILALPSEASTAPGPEGRFRERPMRLEVALDFNDRPFEYNRLICPADSKEELREALRVVTEAYRAALSQPEGPQASGGGDCLCCANGNDLPDGEECAACGRVGDIPPGAPYVPRSEPSDRSASNESPLARAVRLARGSFDPPSIPLKFSSSPAPVVTGSAETSYTVEGALRRLVSVAHNLAGELFDPGTEALAAIYCAERALSLLHPAPPLGSDASRGSADREVGK